MIFLNGETDFIKLMRADLHKNNQLPGIVRAGQNNCSFTTFEALFDAADQVYLLGVKKFVAGRGSPYERTIYDGTIAFQTWRDVNDMYGKIKLVSYRRSSLDTVIYFVNDGKVTHPTVLKY